MQTHRQTPTATYHRGGQHQIGTFGLPGCGDRFRPKAKTAPCTPLATPPAPVEPPEPKADDQPRRIGGLSYGQRQAKWQARFSPLACKLAKLAEADRWEVEREEQAKRAAETPAMLANARRADERERRAQSIWEHCEEMRKLASGFTNRVLSEEGA